MESEKGINKRVCQQPTPQQTGPYQAQPARVVLDALKLLQMAAGNL